MVQPGGCLFSSLFGLLLIAAIALAASIVPVSVETSAQQFTVEVSSPLLAQLAAEEAQWTGQSISGYTMSVRTASFWGVQTHQVTVRDGQIVDSSATCQPGAFNAGVDGECEVQPFDPVDFTVEGLFAKARRTAEMDGGQFTEIDFAPVYHFPTRISFDNPDIYDEQWSWMVESFEPIE